MILSSMYRVCRLPTSASPAPLIPLQRILVGIMANRSTTGCMRQLPKLRTSSSHLSLQGSTDSLSCPQPGEPKRTSSQRQGGGRLERIEFPHVQPRIKDRIRCLGSIWERRVGVGCLARWLQGLHQLHPSDRFPDVPWCRERR